MKLNHVVNLTEMIELMLDAVCVVDKTGRVLFVSAAFEHIFGYTPAEVINEPVSRFVVHDDKEKTAEVVDKILAGAEQRSFENRWVHKSGKIVDVLWSARWSEEHQVRIAVAHDITQRKMMEAELHYLANHDSLTKLPNRAYLEKYLKDSFSLTKKEERDLCLFFIDVDGFKFVNDSHGHIAGDEVLKIIATRLKHSVHSSDVVGRLSGDEFLVILNEIDSKEDAQALAEKIRKVAEEAITIDNTALQLSVSVGIAFCPDDVTSEKELLKRADKAMYHAKRAGGNNVWTLLN